MALTRDIAPFQLRMPPDLHRRVKEAAKREGRSMNAQIVYHLRLIYQADIQDAAE